MKNIQYHPHTADIRLSIEADCLPELFEAGLQGMSNLLKNEFCRQKLFLNRRSYVEIKAVDMTCLLVDFLSEALTRSYMGKTVFCRLYKTEFSENSLSTYLLGSQVDFFDEDIKAVTYHEAEVQKRADHLWTTNLIFDI